MVETVNMVETQTPSLAADCAHSYTELPNEFRERTVLTETGTGFTNNLSIELTMAAAYTILGRSVPSNILAIATLGAVVFVCAPKPWGPAKPVHPPINAASAEEEKFVKDFLAKHAEKH